MHDCYTYITNWIKRSTARRSTLYLQICNKTHATQLRIISLSNGMQSFCIHSPREPIRIDVTRFCIATRVTTSTKRWRITDLLMGEKLNVPREIWISPCKASIIQRLVQDGEPLLIHSHEFNYLAQKQRSTAVV